MSATVDLSSLAIETPVAHLNSHRTSGKASSKSSRSPQTVDTLRACPTFRCGLLSGNCKRVNYSTMRNGFQTSEYEAAPELLSPLSGPGSFQARTAVASTVKTNILMNENKTERQESSKLPTPVDEQYPKLGAEICAPVNGIDSCDILMDSSAVSSRLLIQHLTQTSTLVKDSTKNGNSRSLAEKGDKDTQNCCLNKDVIRVIIDDDSEEWSEKDEDEIECGECSKIFCNIQSFMDHKCCTILEVSNTSNVVDVVQPHPTTLSSIKDLSRFNNNLSKFSSKDCLTKCISSDRLSTNDAVRFPGKIMFTPNGSAYVVEDTAIDHNTFTELGNSILHEDDGSVLCSDVCMPQLSSVIFFPKMNSSLITSLTQKMSEKLERSISSHPFYSYHVIDVRGVRVKDILQILSPTDDRQQTPQPVVMCFICKFIFRETESLLRHAECVHSVDVPEDKRALLVRFNNSIVCNTGGKGKPPQISVLLPMDDSRVELRGADCASNSCRRKLADFVTNRHFSDCERKMFFCDNGNNSFTPPKKAFKITENSVFRDNFTSVCPRKSNTSSLLFDGKQKTGNDDYLRVSSPVSSTMPCWYSLPSTDKPKIVTCTDSSAISRTITSPSDTQPASTCRSSPLCLTQTSATTSNITSLQTPMISSSHSAVFNNQLDSAFSTAITFSASNCLQVTGFSCQCDQLSQERTHTEDCPKYDMTLDSSLYLGHHSSLIHTRNSCKTLKCPKCNWHYKYQETLDIHMKEKHPETDAQCVYCLTNQNHPRLTRGESYACGYKPYRCEVCNYSTTTKGNLSIHMQSDKHINNMQDLVSGSPGLNMPSQQPHNSHAPAATVSFPSSTMSLSPNETLSKGVRQKQLFKCDICNYETSLVRNLRIHMTSEKHTHNVFVVSQGFSHILQDASIDQVNAVLPFNNHEQARKVPALRLVPNAPFFTDSRDLESEMPGCSFESKEKRTCSSQEIELDLSIRRSPSQDTDVMFKCCVCNQFGADQLEVVQNHIQHDRTTTGSSDHHTSTNDGDYLCNMCSYKTPLKANLHLHCKTDKHLHKLQMWNHILEGGPENEWKLSSPDFSWQIYCTPCRFYANSINNMQLHVSSSEHEIRGNIFRHLRVLERAAPIPAEGNLRCYHCSLCTVNVGTKQQLITHSRTARHISKEEIETQHRQPSCDLFLVKELAMGEDVGFLPEDDDNKINCSDITETSSLGCGSISNATIITHPDIIHPDIIQPDIIQPDIIQPDIIQPDIIQPDIIQPDIIQPDIIQPDIIQPHSETSPNHSTWTESTSPQCCSIHKNADITLKLTPPESRDNVKQTTPDGANYETAKKTVDVSLSSALTSGSTMSSALTSGSTMSSALTSGSTMSSMKAEVSTPGTTSFCSSTTKLTEKGTCGCSSGGFLKCYCSHVPDSSGNRTLPGKERQSSRTLLCPLCRHDCRDTAEFEEHLVKEHNVTKEGMQRLMSLVSIPSSIPPSIISSIPPSIPLARSPILSKTSTPSSEADKHHSYLSLSSSPLSTCKLIQTVDEPEDPTPPVSASQMVLSDNDYVPEEPSPQSHLNFKTDPITNSFPNSQGRSPQASSHPISSPRPSTTTSNRISSPQPSTTSPDVMLSPAQETISSSTSPLASTSEASPNLPTQEEFREIDLQLVEAQHASLVAAEGVDLTVQERLDREFEELFKCQTCSKPFSDIDRLYDHQNELGHLQLKQTPHGPGYLCWKKGCNQYFKTALTLQVHFREIHAKKSLAGILSAQEFELYRFRCEQCNFSFKSSSALEKHSLVHLIQSVTQCRICSRKFSCKSKMRRHLEMGHTDLNVADINFQVEKFNKNMQILFTSPTFEQFTSKVLMTNGNTKPQVFSLMNQEKREEHEMVINEIDVKNNMNKCGSFMDTSDSELEKCQDRQFKERDMNMQLLAEEQYKSRDVKFKCHLCMLGYADDKDMLAHMKTFLHEYNVKEEIANAKDGCYKCNVCKKPFKEESDFLEHCNSTGHQMKYKHQNVISMGNPHLNPSSTSGITPSSARVSSPSIIGHFKGGSDTILGPYSSDMKSYKCNVCLIDFNNQSGLEIHLRSEYHKTRANKQGEILFSDLTNDNHTLPKNPDPRAGCRLQAQIIADMIHQQATAQAVPTAPLPYFNLQNLQEMNAVTQLSLLGLLPTTSHASLSTPAPNSLMVFSNAQMEACLTSVTSQCVKTRKVQDSNGMSTSANLQLSEITSAPNLTEASASSTHVEGSKNETSDNGTKAVSDLIETKISTDVKISRKNNELPPQFHAPVIARPRGFMGRFKPQLYKSLLENFGFEFVMHFNEEHTRISETIDMKEENVDTKEEYSDELSKDVESNTGLAIQINECTEDEEMSNTFKDKNEVETETSESNNKAEITELTSERNNKAEITEISRQQCKTCQKFFSNLWVLKNHEEEMHNFVVAADTIENFGQKFKEEWEKSLPKLQEQEPGSLLQSPTNPPCSSAPPAVEKSSTVDLQQAKPSAAQPQLPCHLELPQLLPFMTMNCLPMHLSMNLMNLSLQNSLMSSMMMQNMDLSQGFLSHIPQSSLIDSSLPVSSQKQLHISAAAAAAAAQKRVRTRISDDQLKVLRQYFDINNSPTEEQVNKMADQTGLPQKVIKHWFRNTLFKERQRNKDSPYNFNNPPCTSFDLGEYDRTGKIPEIKLEVDEDFDRDATPAPDMKRDFDRDPTPVPDVKKETSLLGNESAGGKSECDTELVENTNLKLELTPKMELYIEERKDQESHSNTSSPSISSITSTPAVSAPATPTPGTSLNTANPLAHSLDNFAANMARLEAATFHNMGKRANRTRFTDYQIKTLQDYFEQNAYPKDDELEHLSKILGLSARVIVVWFQNARQKARKIYENHPTNESLKDAPSPYQRTSGMNYQCKKCNSVFQRYYELNKHQKHFCVMESNNNKPIPSMIENDSSFSFSNDDSFLSDYQITPVSTTKSRDAQNSSYPPKPSISNTTTCVIPTAATSPSSASSSSFFIPSFKCDKCSMTFSRFDTWQEHQRAHSIAPAMFTPFSSNPAFRMLENLAYHENDKTVVTTATSPACSSILHSMVFTPTTNSSSHEPPAIPLTPTSSSSSLSPSSKRKTDSEDESGEQPKDKRLRTTILPEQLDYLYQQYQVDCNPSRKQLEHIASTVNLKKRVVQVWFQNTRARERKGHYRAHQQLINKRCPFCRALFRAKSALESHLATKHPEQLSKGDINIDLIPDAIVEPLPGQIHTSLPSYFSHTSSPLSSLYMASDMKFPSSSTMATLPNYVALMSASSGINLPFPGSAADFMGTASFEDPFFKKYMKDLTKAVSGKQDHSLLQSYNHMVTPETASNQSTVRSYTQATPTDFSNISKPIDAHNSKITPLPSAFSSNDDAPLDLSKPIKTTETLPNDPASHAVQSTNVDYNDQSSEREFHQRQSNLDDTFSETQSEMADHEYTNDVSYSSPSPSHMSNSFILNAGSVGSIGKRYRTQMSAVQVRVMKQLFRDYKTPTMVECEFLGQEIGLPKRVVQVWFQNARAKEKKARLTSGKSFNSEAHLTKSPEECQLCRCKYTHKVTLQDHIFTKAHIDKIKAFLNSQGDLDNDLNSSTFPGVFQSSNEADHPNKRWDNSVSSLQNSKLVSSAGLSYATTHAERSQKSHEKELPKKERKTEDTISRNELKQNQAVLEMAMNAQMFSTLGGYMPGLDPAYLPYMYGGVPGYFPGMGLPLVQPGIISEHMMPYDPLVFGTPLNLLQIPSTAKKSVSEKVKEAGSILAQYTQDCHVLADLHNVVSASDLTAAAEATLDVGFICKKCHVVFPARDSCITHQRSLCMTNTSSLPKGFEPIMKLEQIQYECRACDERFSTISEFKSHCQQDSHKQKLMKFKMKEAVRREAAESPSSSAPYVPSPGNVNLLSPYIPKSHTVSSLFNNNSISHNNNQVTSPGVSHGMKLPLLPLPAHQYNKAAPAVSPAFTDKHTAAFSEVPDIHRVKAE